MLSRRRPSPFISIVCLYWSPVLSKNDSRKILMNTFFKPVASNTMQHRINKVARLTRARRYSVIVPRSPKKPIDHWRTFDLGPRWQPRWSIVIRWMTQTSPMLMNSNWVPYRSFNGKSSSTKFFTSTRTKICSFRRHWFSLVWPPAARRQRMKRSWRFC